MRIPQAVADNLAERIRRDYPQAVGVKTLPLPIGCVFVIAHPRKQTPSPQFVVGLLSDDTKGCAVLKRLLDADEAEHLAMSLRIALTPFMNASLDLMGVDHTHIEV